MTDEYWMRRALIEARRAAEKGEVPVGAVIVWTGESESEKSEIQTEQSACAGRCGDAGHSTAKPKIQISPPRRHNAKIAGAYCDTPKQNFTTKARNRIESKQSEQPVESPMKVIGQGHNQMESLRDPTAHAEILAITAAANYLNNWRLTGTTIYVTVEPCLMCTGALVLARVRRVVFGVRDEKSGACGSVYDIPWDNRFNHQFQVTPGILTEECGQLLRDFFGARRSS